MTQNQNRRAVQSTAAIDDGWTLSPEIEALLVAPVAPLVKKGPAKINLNSATIDELCDLPGIGRSKAKQIILWRTKNGPFESPEALIAVNGIGAQTVKALSPRLA